MLFDLNYINQMQDHSALLSSSYLFLLHKCTFMEVWCALCTLDDHHHDM